MPYKARLLMEVQLRVDAAKAASAKTFEGSHAAKEAASEERAKLRAAAQRPGAAPPAVEMAN